MQLLLDEAADVNKADASLCVTAARHLKLPALQLLRRAGVPWTHEVIEAAIGDHGGQRDSDSGREDYFEDDRRRSAFCGGRLITVCR